MILILSISFDQTRRVCYTTQRARCTELTEDDWLPTCILRMKNIWSSGPCCLMVFINSWFTSVIVYEGCEFIHFYPIFSIVLHCIVYFLLYCISLCTVLCMELAILLWVVLYCIVLYCTVYMNAPPSPPTSHPAHPPPPPQHMMDHAWSPVVWC